MATKYVRLKDRRSSRGIMILGKVMNNSTVLAFDENQIPSTVLVAIRNHQLEYCKKADYDKYVKDQKEAEENGKKAKEKRRAEFVKRVAAKSGETEEEVEKKTTKKAEEKKAKEEKKATTKKSTKKAEPSDNSDDGEEGDK